MAWLAELAQQITTATGAEITQDELMDEIRDFIESTPDPVLRSSYPKDISHFDRADNPQVATKDLMLSFMSHRYPSVRCPLMAIFAQSLRKTARVKDGDSATENILRMEALRRGGHRGPAKDTYWYETRERLESRYGGLYLLVRIDSKATLRAEPLHVQVNHESPHKLDCHWLCQSHMRVGELLVNSYRFVGYMLRSSTDDVIEPVSLVIMRSRRRTEQQDIGQLVLGGVVTGWSDREEALLLSSRVALLKVPTTGADLTALHALDVLQSGAVKKLCTDVMQNEAVSTRLRENFLRETANELSPDEAANALGDFAVTPINL